MGEIEYAGLHGFRGTGERCQYPDCNGRRTAPQHDVPSDDNDRHPRVMLDLLVAACNAPEQVRAWVERHGMPHGSWTVDRLLAAVEKDHQEAADANGPKLNFKRAAGATSVEQMNGYTAYEAEAHGVRYRIVGNPFTGLRGKRVFRVYRDVGTRLVPVAGWGSHRSLAAAKAQAEQDLSDVLRDREGSR